MRFPGVVLGNGAGLLVRHEDDVVLGELAVPGILAFRTWTCVVGCPRTGGSKCQQKTRGDYGKTLAHRLLLFRGLPVVPTGKGPARIYATARAFSFGARYGAIMRSIWGALARPSSRPTG